MRKVLPSLWAVLSLLACAHTPAREESLGGGGPGGGVLNARWVCGDLPEPDAFDSLVLRAGLPLPDPPVCGPLTPSQALEMRRQLLVTPTTTRNFPVRLTLAFLLREVEDGGRAVTHEGLASRMERFHFLAVLRPDGYLASALYGKTIQNEGPLSMRDGALFSRAFQLGRFYSGRTVYRPVDGHLEPIPSSPPLDEVYNDADVINRSLDGFEDALVDLASALSRLLLHPIQSAQDLSHLPSALVTLLVHSPEYLERFLLMTHGEQIEAVSRLTSNVLLALGGASATTGGLTAKGMQLGRLELPVLSLGADGVLALERVAVPVGQAATALAGAPGAVYVLQMANQGAQQAVPKWQPPSGGPGAWIAKNEAKSAEAARYETQVTGAPSEYSYRVPTEKLPGAKNDFVDFDGFKDGILLEAKGPGYAKWLDASGKFRDFFEGRKELMNQARRQFKAAKGTPLQWHFAEREVADWARNAFKNSNLNIQVVDTPVLPVTTPQVTP